jgi:biofilm PGA synthesis N-glycosyltransferase PgaC
MPAAASESDMLVDNLNPTCRDKGRHVARQTYVLVTAAYNEEQNIEKAIRSVLAQTRLPERWVIVSDGSMDRTDEIVQSYAAAQDWMRFLRMVRAPGRSFGSKVRALQAGSKLLEGVTSDFVGNLDADVSLEPFYFENLMARFQERPTLGIAGGFVCEDTSGEFQSRRSNRTYSVAHAAQLVRRECYETIGGYAVLEYGGEDWHAQTSARMKGWEAEAFPELKIFHHRHTGEGDNLIRHKFRQGRMDYSFGSDPLFEVLKCAERIPEKPFLFGSIARLSGFVWSFVSADRRPVSPEFIAFMRSEQRTKLRSMFSIRSRRSHPQA